MFGHASYSQRIGRLLLRAGPRPSLRALTRNLVTRAWNPDCSRERAPHVDPDVDGNAIVPSIRPLWRVTLAKLSENTVGIVDVCGLGLW
jgi:hypothetical protein